MSRTFSSKIVVFIILTCVVISCGIRPVPPVTPTLPMVTSTLSIVKNESCWETWRQTQSETAYDCAIKEYSRAVDQVPALAENHFRFGVLNWEGNDKKLGREEIINAVRLDILNENFIEYLFGQVIPPPVQVNIPDDLPLYTEQFDTSYLITQADNVRQFELKEAHTPSNVADGASAIQLDWQKPSMTWASLIFGFDPDIADREKALTGGFVSLGGLNRSNLGEYALTFWVKGEDIQVEDQYKNIDPYLRIKLQDQNLAVRESIGNQMVYTVAITDKWKKYSIPFDDFQYDRWWIHKAVCTSNVDYWECQKAALLQFDWSRIKQINFDIPYYSTSGRIFLDDIHIVRNR